MLLKNGRIFSEGTLNVFSKSLWLMFLCSTHFLKSDIPPYCLLGKHRRPRLGVESIDSISSAIREHLIQFNFVINLMFNPLVTL